MRIVCLLTTAGPTFDEHQELQVGIATDFIGSRTAAPVGRASAPHDRGAVSACRPASRVRAIVLLCTNAN